MSKYIKKQGEPRKCYGPRHKRPEDLHRMCIEMSRKQRKKLRYIQKYHGESAVHIIRTWIDYWDHGVIKGI